MIVAGTGHRPSKLGGYSAEASRRLHAFACMILTEIKPALVISGMALGWDQALAHAACSLRIPFDAYVPFLGQEGCWPESSQARYRALLAKTRNTYICSTGGYSARAMQGRNEQMVDACDTVLSLWDGGGGGTANCVTYARTQWKSIMQLWEPWCRFQLNQPQHECQI